MYDLLDHGPSTITELAERTGYAQSRVSSAVAGLCERSWTQTRSDPADGRRTIVHVPDKVQRVLAEREHNALAASDGLALDARDQPRRLSLDTA